MRQSKTIRLYRFIKKASIQKRIFLYFFSLASLCVIVGFLIVSTIFINRFKEIEQTNAINRINEAEYSIEFIFKITGNTAQLISTDEDFLSILTEENLTRHPEYFSKQREINYWLKKIISVHEYIDNIYMIGDQGEFFTSYWDFGRSEIVENLKSIDKINHFFSKKGFDNNLVSYKQDDRDRMSISYVTEIKKHPGGDRLGVLILDLNYTYLREVFQHSSLQQDDEMILLLNTDQEPLFSFPFNVSLMPIIDDYPQLIDKATQMEGEVFGRAAFLVSGDISFTNWKIIRIIFQDNIFDTIEEIRVYGIVIGLILLMISSIASYILSFSITLPIIELNNSISLVKEGNLQVQVEHRREDEIGQLQESFNDMVETINLLMNKTLEEQKRKSDLEFEVLQAQINPHFLYNTLDSIKWLAVFHNQEHIADMVNSLINLLKYNISKREVLVPFSEEISIIHDYIEIQKYRFGDSFSVEFDLQEETLQLYILKFILQPIIENSLFHGFQNMDFHGVIVLRSFISGDKLVIEIEDNGRGFSTNPEQNSQAEQLDRKKMCTKIGLSNVRNRINIHFKGEGNLSLESPAKGGALVRIELPVLGELQKV